MTYYSIPSFLGAIFALILGFLTYIKQHENSTNRAFARFSIVTFFWLFFYSLLYSTVDIEKAKFLIKIGYSAVIFMPVSFYHFTCSFLDLKSHRKILVFSYIVSLTFLFTLYFTDYFVDGVYQYFWGYYPKAGILHPLFLVFVFGSVGACDFLLFIRWWGKRQDNSIYKRRILYIFLAFNICSFVCVDFIPNYGIKIFPFGFIFVLIFVVIISYAIIKYRLMDISLAITRTGLFIAVYSIVLGIPFAIAFGWQERLIYAIGDNWWLVPLISSTVLATAGPFIYLYIQKRAEARLFQEQKRYQSTLRQASAGMGRIKDITRLVNLIVHIVSRTVRLEHALVYLFNSETNLYQLRAARAKFARFKTQEVIGNNSSIIKHLIRMRNPIVYEEIKQQTQDYGDMNLARLESELAVVNAELVVPCFIDDKLLAVIVLGKKVSNDLFSESDLAVFSILANQAALAMENAMFYEEMKNTHAQLMKAEKMATIGTMADGLSHQINNRLHALGFIAGDALDTIKLKKDVFVSPEVKEVMIDLEHALHRIEDNVTQGGEIVRGLLKYTRKGEEGFSELEFDQLVNAAVEMTQFKIKPGEIQIAKEYGKDTPKINGNFTQLQEVFFNLIDNAYDAMMQRKNELKEKGYSPVIKIYAEGDHNGRVNIRFEDNGIGIKEEDKTRLFTPFFTTKLSSKKGTGLGLYVIQKLIEENHNGKVVYNSVYKQGTNVLISLHALR